MLHVQTLIKFTHNLIFKKIIKGNKENNNYYYFYYFTTITTMHIRKTVFVPC